MVIVREGSAKNSTSTGQSSSTFNYTLINSAGANRLVIVGVNFEEDNVNSRYVTNVTFSGVSMTQLPNSPIKWPDSGLMQYVAFYYLLDSQLPSTSGSKQIIVTLDGVVSYDEIMTYVAEYSGVNQGPPDDYASDINYSSGSTSVTLTPSNDNSVGFLVVGSGGSTDPSGNENNISTLQSIVNLSSSGAIGDLLNQSSQFTFGYNNLYLREGCIGAVWSPSGIIFKRSSGSTGTSLSIDIGSSGNNRLIIAVLGDESKPGDTFQGTVSVGGKQFTQTVVADNPDGVGNHLEVHTIHESVLGSTSGTLTVSYSGGDGGWAIHVLVFYGVKDNIPIDYGKNDTTIGYPVPVYNITSNNESLIFMAAGNGSSGSASSWSSPLVELTDGPNPSSAVLATAYGIESIGKTNKTYSVDIGNGSLRSTAIVLAFDKWVDNEQIQYLQMIL